MGKILRSQAKYFLILINHFIFPFHKTHLTYPPLTVPTVNILVGSAPSSLYISFHIPPSSTPAQYSLSIILLSNPLSYKPSSHYFPLTRFNFRKRNLIFTKSIFMILPFSGKKRRNKYFIDKRNLQNL